ncbi:MAG: ubiquitin, partial [Clostridiaceae bacterium]|nr:ubiquitin [Clostridiaceae bacterium]
MVTLEQAERLCARANISYEEAKRILEETNGDLLEAVIRLEKEGKVTPPKNDGSYSTQEEEKSTVNNEQEPERFLTFKEILRNIINWFVKLIRIGNVNYFDVYQNGV